MYMGLLVFVPLFLRFFILILIKNNSFKRISHYPKAKGIENIMINMYQFFTIFVTLIPLRYSININSNYFIIGISFYLIGLILWLSGTINFAQNDQGKLCINGLFKYSRNPIYVGYYLYYIGFAFIIQSPLYIIVLALFIITSHILILVEEKWCLDIFGNEFIVYKSKIRRYI